MSEFASNTIGVFRAELRDARKIVANIDARLRHASPAGPPPRHVLGKLLACYVLAARRSTPPAAIASDVYRNDAALLDALAKPATIAKAVTNPAMTTAAGWAAELVQTVNAGLLQVVAPSSVYAQLSAREASERASLVNTAGTMKIPTRAAPTAPVGSPFVAEGAPIRARKLPLTSGSLAAKKAAFISTFTDELFQHSVPSIELFVRAALETDTAIGIDGVLLGTAAADAANPAGILSGVTPTAATAGGGLAALAADVRALAAAIEASGAMSDPVLIMSSTSGLLVALLSQGGATDMPVIAAPTVPAKQLIMVDAANFASAEGDEPKITASRSATYHEEDTNPQPIGTPGTPAVVAAPVRSLFQTDSVALRLIQHVTWAMTRTGRVAYIDAVSW